MATVYPNQIDNNNSLALLVDGVSLINADSINRVRNAVIAVENELGVNPAGIYGTVANRLFILESLIAGGGGSIAVPNIEITLATLNSVSSNTFTRVGGGSVDFSKYPSTLNGLTRAVQFHADIQKTAGATNVEIQLVDVSGNATITGTDLTYSTNTTTTKVASGNLTVGSSLGNLRSDIVAQYEVQLRMNGGMIGTDQAFCVRARLFITYS